MKWRVPHLRSVHPLHSAKVADALRGVSQVVALVVDPVRHLLVMQVLLQLMLGCSVCSITQRRTWSFKFRERFHKRERNCPLY